MRIVFMGTPEFAVPSLEALLKSDDQVVGIVTQPDRPKGRGQQLAPSPVKVIAQREHLPLLQPTKMKAPEFLSELSGWNADVIAVAAFGRAQPVQKRADAALFGFKALRPFGMLVTQCLADEIFASLAFLCAE